MYSQIDLSIIDPNALIMGIFTFFIVLIPCILVASIILREKNLSDDEIKAERMKMERANNFLNTMHRINNG